MYWHEPGKVLDQSGQNLRMDKEEVIDLGSFSWYMRFKILTRTPDDCASLLLEFTLEALRRQW